MAKRNGPELSDRYRRLNSSLDQFLRAYFGEHYDTLGGKLVCSSHAIEHLLTKVGQLLKNADVKNAKQKHELATMVNRQVLLAAILWDEWIDYAQLTTPAHITKDNNLRQSIVNAMNAKFVQDFSPRDFFRSSFLWLVFRRLHLWPEAPPESAKGAGLPFEWIADIMPNIWVDSIFLRHGHYHSNADFPSATEDPYYGSLVEYAQQIRSARSPLIQDEPSEKPKLAVSHPTSRFNNEPAIFSFLKHMPDATFIPEVPMFLAKYAHGPISDIETFKDDLGEVLQRIECAKDSSTQLIRATSQDKSSRSLIRFMRHFSVFNHKHMKYAAWDGNSFSGEGRDFTTINYPLDQIKIDYEQIFEKSCKWDPKKALHICQECDLSIPRGKVGNPGKDRSR